MSNLITLNLGRYRIVDRGRGCLDFDPNPLTEAHLGRLTGARWIEHHVLRWLRPELGDDDLARAFFDQARLAAYLRHPNIVSIVDVVEQPGLEYVASEYIHGETLQRVLRRVRAAGEQVPIAMVVAIASAAAAGLHHAHTLTGRHGAPLGIVHGAVSPSSIVVGYDGCVRVEEFGIAPVALQAAVATPGALGRLASYLSPEAAQGRPLEPRGDVFALGAVMYELATGRRLFGEETEAETLRAITHGEVPPPSRFRAELPRALEAVILKALAAAPGDRYRSAEALRAGLAAFAASIGMRVSAASVADYMKSLFGVRPLPWLAAERRGWAGAWAAAVESGLDSGEPGVVAPPGRHRAAPSHRAPTPLSWATDAAPEAPRRQPVRLIAGAAAAAVASFFAVGLTVRGSGDGAAELAPLAAPPAHRAAMPPHFPAPPPHFAAPLLPDAISPPPPAPAADRVPAAPQRVTPAPPAAAPQPTPRAPRPPRAKPSARRDRPVAAAPARRGAARAGQA